MRSRALLLAALVWLPLACGGTQPASGAATVARVIDGDTIVLADGSHVRLVQLDAPETTQNECYAAEAAHDLERLLPPGTAVRIELDPALDHVDRFGRTLAYVMKGGANVNLELVREGAAAPYFFHDDRGRFAAQLLQAAGTAKSGSRGLWGACPRTVLDPLHQVDAER